ncbi:MAG: hypothetical protein LWX51_18220 [Deltaproteobacteria bacterium]|jgi:hypothetical protein|nr:hypothetical protein [Deltaproteobacteria bacterium]
MDKEKKDLIEFKVYKLNLAEIITIAGVIITFITLLWFIIQYAHSTFYSEKEKLYEQRIALLQERLKMVGEKYYIEEKGGQINKQEPVIAANTILPSPYFTFASIKNGDILTIDSNVHIDGYLRDSNFNPKEGFIWVFFKLDDNFYIKPNSKATFEEESFYWDTILRWDNNYNSIVVFRVKSDGNNKLMEWSTYKYGGIKINEFPVDAVKLGEVSINSYP